MAISGAAPMMGMSAASANPGPTNNYNIWFGDFQGATWVVKDLPKVLHYKYWKNPYADQLQNTIPPYFPIENNELKSAFEKNIFKDGIPCIEQSIVDCAFKNSGVDRFFLERKEDVFTVICIHLTPEDLTHFSEVSKCCYLATKTNCFWNIQTKKQLNVSCLPTTTCSFTPKQQFHIFLKRLQDRKRPFIAQLNHYQERIAELLTTIQTAEPHHKPLLLAELQKYVGADYKGTLESVSPLSKLGECLVALASIPQMEFNQTEFDRIIQAYEVARNNTSNTEEPQVEDVTDDV